MSTVIAVLPDSTDAHMISDSLNREGIAVNVVRSPEDALRMMAGEKTSVVLYDADTGQPWPDALPRFTAMQPGVRVVLLTQCADQRTWLDLFDRGGFDLLPRPFQAANLRSVVRCALDPPKFFCSAA